MKPACGLERSQGQRNRTKRNTGHICVWGKNVWVAGVEVWVKVGIGGV